MQAPPCIETLRVALPPSAAGQPAPWLICRAAGPVDAPLLIFLHGFPEAAFVWDDLLRRFGRRWRCVAPNLRGYAGSYAPADVEAYRAQHLIADISALIAVLRGATGQAAAVIAHDWGGAVGWGLAIQQPQRLRRLVMLNSPHPGVFLRTLRDDPAQQAASAYMNLLREPGVEARLASDDFGPMWSFFTRFGGATWLTEYLRSQYRLTWQAGLTGPLNYYRASPLYPPTTADDPVMKLQWPEAMLQVRVPTTVIWGETDTALLPCQVDGLGVYVPDLKVVRLPEASHWLLHEQPDQVGVQIEQALGAAGGRSAGG